MTTTANGLMALEAIEDLRMLYESETQELYDNFEKYKKYAKHLEVLVEWDNQDTSKYLEDIESKIKKKKLTKESEYRLAVYVGRYPSYFITLKDINFSGSREQSLEDRLEVLMSIETQIGEYLEVLEELQ